VQINHLAVCINSCGAGGKENACTFCIRSISSILQWARSVLCASGHVLRLGGASGVTRAPLPRRFAASEQRFDPITCRNLCSPSFRPAVYIFICVSDIYKIHKFTQAQLPVCDAGDPTNSSTNYECAKLSDVSHAA
jgi:predicted Fe-S protein YdhL (DUF1289 family)